MTYRTFNETILLRLDPGEEILASLKRLCEQENIVLGAVQGIGAARFAVLGLFPPATKQYTTNRFEEIEIVSLTGNITAMDGEPYLHLHMAVADAQGRTFGGHLTECVISATAEIVVKRIDGAVGRKFSEEIGLNQMDL